MLNRGRFIIVINADAGLVRRRGARTIETEVAGALSDNLIEVIATDRQRLARTLQAIAKRRPLAVGVVGGDGTAHTALEILTPVGIPIAPLPGGTLNRLSRRVFGRQSMDACLRAMLFGEDRPLPGALVDGRRFFVAAGFGAWMQFQQLRESVRGKGAVSAIRLAMRSAPTQFAERLHWVPDHGGALVNSTLVVGVGRIDHALGTYPQAHEPALLEAAGADLRGWSDMYGVALSVLLRRWRRHPQVTSLASRTLSVMSEHDGTPAILDGEFQMLGQRFQIMFEPHCGLVWSPKKRP